MTEPRLTIEPGLAPVITTWAADSGPLGSSFSITVAYGDIEIRFADADTFRALLEAGQRHLTSRRHLGPEGR